MFRKILTLLFSTTLIVGMAACGGQQDEPADDTGMAEALARARAAVPTEAMLRADAPGDATAAAGDANLPGFAVGAAQQINAWALLSVRIVRTVVMTPPTVYNSSTKEFVWGPWPNNDGYGNVMVYVRENPPGEDFDYIYAFVRLTPDNDFASAKPIIWGAATPDPTDPHKGTGVTLWDFEENRAWENLYDPAPPAQQHQGRFAALYGRGTGTDGDFAFNVAMFRNFLPADGSTGGVIDLDYFYGKFFANDGNTLAFLDWLQDADLCDSSQACFQDRDGVTPSTGNEQLGVRMAFFNDGLGRGEATLSGTDLGTRVIDITECWTPLIDNTYWAVTDGTASVVDPPGATPADCGLYFQDSLSTLGIPSLADIDPATYAALDCVASNGVEFCTAGTTP